MTDCPHRAMLAVMTISHATDLWLGELTRQGHSDRTVDKYRRLLDKLADAHSRHTDVADLTVVHVRGFLDRQAKRANGTRKAPATIAQDVSTVCGFFDWLTSEGIIGRNPTRRNGDRIVTRPRQTPAEENDNITSISGDGVRKLIAEANTGSWPERLAVNCLVYAGARRHAVAQLRIGDYDPVGRMLTFHEKGGKTIEKPVPHALARVIESAVAAGVYDTIDDYLIPSRAQQRRAGERDDRIIWRLVRDVAARAGVDTHVHALRAAFAVHFLESNEGELVALQKLMGHKRIETTLVYLRRLDRRQAMETVRDLSWDVAGVDTGDSERFPQIARESFDAFRLAEKEGFEPSLGANPLRKPEGTDRETPAPVAAYLDELRRRAKRGVRGSRG